MTHARFVHFALGLLPIGALSALSAAAADVAPAAGQQQAIAPQPLYRDPIHDGAADPVLVWQRAEKKWFMLYTNRRANVPDLSGVAWVHGTRIGMAESADGGTTWTHAGVAGIDESVGATLWAPDVVFHDGLYHMFLTVVPGVFEDWQHPRTIVHLTSRDLRHWGHPRPLALASDRVIDASVLRMPDGTWRLWYNNERDRKSIYLAESPDLERWTDRGKVLDDRPGEGPKVFFWRGRYWMLVDNWQGLGVYRSTDATSWTRQGENLLATPGQGPDDQVKGGHPDVVVSGQRAFLFYFTHPGRRGADEKRDAYEQRRSSIQVVELELKDGWLACDRNQPTHVELLPPEEVPPAALVDPFIGTTGDGNVFPGAVRPWGLASASPHTDVSSPSGFHDTGRQILGFGQVHISGAGCPDLGNILLSATTGEVKTDESGYRSLRGKELAQPGYYAVDLDTYGVRAEMTATARANLYRFTFPQREGDANLILDVAHALTPSAAAEVRIVSPTELEGWSRSGDFCGKRQKQTVYFVAQVNKTPSLAGTWKNGQASPAPREAGTDVGVFLRFATTAGEALLVRLGVSYVSVSNARRNLEAEIPHWDFDRLRREAFEEWNRELSRIEVTGGTEDERVLFYTGLYHVLIHPSVFSDVNGEYAGMNDAGVRVAKDYTHYHLYSLWDTYRNVHPLLALLYPSRQRDMAQSLVDKQRESGWLPIWELAGQETNVMVGDPAAIVLGDTVVKGIRDFDLATAFAAVKKQGTQAPPPGTQSVGRPGVTEYLRLGYVPEPPPPRVWGSAATTLEYGAADFAAAQLAKAAGSQGDARLFLRRSRGWRKLFDRSTGFIRPRSADGHWLTPFDPVSNCPKPPCEGAWGMGSPGFVEGSAWQYTFMVNYDIPGLIELLGGPACFTAKLQEAFDAGHYKLNNEPDMAYPYLFTFLPGESWRTARQVRKDLATEFRRAERRLPGNDDAGATSAVYVFGAMGFYPVTPALPEYRLGSPLFDKVVLHLDPKYAPGGTFTIEARHNSAANAYIQSATLNGQPWREARLPHEVVLKGGSLALVMGTTK
jgi:predicted alpha-1,2-mannosidase